MSSVETVGRLGRGLRVLAWLFGGCFLAGHAALFLCGLLHGGQAVVVHCLFWTVPADWSGLRTETLCFSLVFAVTCGLWLWLCDRRLGRLRVAVRGAVLGVAFVLGLFPAGWLYAYHDMAMGFWPGWSSFISNVKSWGWFTATSSTEIAHTRPELVIAYLLVGLWLLQRAERCLPARRAAAEARVVF